MEVTTKDGQTVKISNEEMKRVAETYAHMHGLETNDAFMNRAAENIKVVTGVKPTTEDELKELLYKNTSGTSMKEIELLFETMEWVAAMHSMKTKSM